MSEYIVCVRDPLMDAYEPGGLEFFRFLSDNPINSAPFFNDLYDRAFDLGLEDFYIIEIEEQ